MEIRGGNALVLGGHGLVGTAVCRRLLHHEPAVLVVASRRPANAREAAARLTTEFPDSRTRILPVWGDVFLRAEWRGDGTGDRAAALAAPGSRRTLISDLLDPLDEEIMGSSLLAQIIEGAAPGLEGSPAGIVVDCMNTATGVAYRDIYSLSRRLAGLSETAVAGAEDRGDAVEILIASLYVPQLVRHMQILYEAMRRAGTRAYIKVGTSGTGGMGFNIPYTHGEERPSRLLLSKAAMAGAQTLLTFLMARTPAGPEIVKEIKPSALIGWREVGHGPIRRGGRDIALYDCPPARAVSVRDPANLTAAGDFGVTTGRRLEGVYIDTGENGLFAASEFAAITALGQMELVTPEEIAENAVAEILGTGTGRDIVSALDGAVMGPSYRGGYLRRAALDHLDRLEAAHGESVAYEILGPPRLSKLLFEAHLLKRASGSLAAVVAGEPRDLAGAVEREVTDDPDLRQRIVSIGIPILLADGERMLRGPVVKSEDAHHGWVDLTPPNMRAWQDRLKAFRAAAGAEPGEDTSSRPERPQGDEFDIGEIAAWIFSVEDKGRRGKR